MKRIFCSGFLAMVLVLTGICLSPAMAADEKLIEAAKKEGTLVVFHSISRITGRETSKRFQEMYPFIDLKFTRKGTGGITRMIEAERMAGALKCDVVSVGDPSVTMRWKKEGLLMKYFANALSAIPERYHDPSGYTSPSRCNYGAIGYNTRTVGKDQAPKNWTDLLDPKWKSRIACSDPAGSAPGRYWLASMLKLYGWDYFKKLAKNKPLWIKQAPATVRALVSGEVDVAMPGNEHDFLLRSRRGEPIGIIYPTDGLSWKVSPVAIMAQAPHPNAAKLWVEFELGPVCQEIYGQTTNMVPVRTGANPKYERPPGALDKVVNVDIEEMSTKMKEWVRELHRIMAQEK